MIGRRRRRPPRLTRQQQLAARPVQLVSADVVDTADGGGRLTVPLPPRRGWAAWLLRVPAGATKTFELDVLGRLVWDACDGRTSVRQIARRLAERTHVSDREATVAVEAFLATLARRGLVGGSVDLNHRDTKARRGVGRRESGDES